MMLPGKVVYLFFDLVQLLFDLKVPVLHNFCISFIQSLVGLYCRFEKMFLRCKNMTLQLWRAVVFKSVT